MSCRFNTGSLGLSNVKIPKFTPGKGTSPNSCKPINLNAFRVCSSLSLEAKSASKFGEDSAETKSHGSISALIPKSSEVCHVDCIKHWHEVSRYIFKWLQEMHVKKKMEPNDFHLLCNIHLDGFRLYITRDLDGGSARSGHPPAPPNPVTANMAVIEPHPNGSLSMPSLAISKPVSSSGDVQPFLDKPADEGLVILKSPRVGFFRRSRTIKGKHAPPSCKEKQIVKEGQVLCYIDQLGGEIPIESDVSGEVIKILREDGEPVGYGDSLITILASFPGIKKLQ